MSAPATFPQNPSADRLRALQKTVSEPGMKPAVNGDGSRPQTGPQGIRQRHSLQGHDQGAAEPDKNLGIKGDGSRPQTGPQRIRHRLSSEHGDRRHGVSRRDHNYDAPIGGYNSSQNSDDDTNTTYRSQAPQYRRRRRIRHELHQKHKSNVVPMKVTVPWVKWMQSDAKNRMSTPRYL